MQLPHLADGQDDEHHIGQDHQGCRSIPYIATVDAVAWNVFDPGFLDWSAREDADKCGRDAVSTNNEDCHACCLCKPGVREDS